MNRRQLYREAQRVVDDVLALLPAELRALANECVIELADRADEPPGQEGELLGYFEGNCRFDPAPAAPDELPRVTLFLLALWEFSEEDPDEFREEVRITLLHELAHYFGFDEDEMAERGLE